MALVRCTCQVSSSRAMTPEFTRVMVSPMMKSYRLPKDNWPSLRDALQTQCHAFESRRPSEAELRARRLACEAPYFQARRAPPPAGLARSEMEAAGSGLFE